MNNYIEALKQSPAGLEGRVELIENTGHVPFSTLNNPMLFFFSGCTMTSERENLSVSGIKAHFEGLSKEYGFTVNPKPGVLLDMAFDPGDENKTDQAIGIMNYLISLYPDSETNYYCLGRLFKKSGDIESAKANYNKALGSNPNHEPSQKALKKLNNLKTSTNFAYL